MAQVIGIDKPLSRVVLGTMIINADEQERSWELLDDAYAAGINVFDTAIVYGGGNSERCLGPWANDRGLREQVVIISKGCIPEQDRERVTPYDLLADVHTSLARLQADYIDIFMFHRDDPSAPVGPLVETMNQLIASGKIRAYGASNWTHTRIQEANDYATAHDLIPFGASSPNYGLAEQVKDPWGPGCTSVSGPQNAEARAWYEHNQLPVFAYSSLARGLFSGRITRENFKEEADGACCTAYCHEVNFQRLDRVRQMASERDVSVAQIALAYVLNTKVNCYPLVGAANREECQQATVAAKIELSPAETAWLDLRD